MNIKSVSIRASFGARRQPAGEVSNVIFVIIV